MRPLPLLGLVVGLAMLGWGGYSLYGRFAGGPEVYWGEDRVKYLAELEPNVAELRAAYAAEEAEAVALRARLADIPPGRMKEDLTQKLDDLTKDLTLHDKVVKDHEVLLTQTLQHRDDAKGRALRRGFLFTILGVLWTARAGRAVLRPTKRNAAR